MKKRKKDAQAGPAAFDRPADGAAAEAPCPQAEQAAEAPRPQAEQAAEALCPPMETIETERLLITPWRDCREDAEGLFAYAGDPDVGPNAGWKPHESVEESAEIIRELFIPRTTWCIREKGTGKIIGSIGLEPDKRREDVNSREMGYSLAKACWGRGYMTEAARAVMDYGFEKLALVVMSICTGPDNKRSQRVIEKCGFKYEGRQRRAYHIYDGTDRDNLVFSILREEWEEVKSRR